MPPGWLIPLDAMLSWRQAGMEEEAELVTTYSLNLQWRWICGVENKVYMPEKGISCVDRDLHVRTYLIPLLKMKSSTWFDDEICFPKGLSGQKSFHLYSECIIYMRGEPLTQELPFLLLTTLLLRRWGWEGCLPVETLTKGPRGFLSKPLSHLAWLTWNFWGANPKAEHLSYSARWFMQECD